jgi:hypothetical protein
MKMESKCETWGTYFCLSDQNHQPVIHRAPPGREKGGGQLSPGSPFATLRVHPGLFSYRPSGASLCAVQR